jgi:YD repeat-containing protein
MDHLETDGGMMVYSAAKKGHACRGLVSNSQRGYSTDLVARWPTARRNAGTHTNLCRQDRCATEPFLARRSDWRDDKDGRETLAVNADGDSTMTTYDKDGNETTQVLGYGSGAAAETQYAYDKDGNQTQVIDPVGNTTTFEYDDDGRKTAVIAPDGIVSGVTTYSTADYAYDHDGNLTQTLDADNRTDVMAYDLDSRMTSEVQYDSSGTPEDTLVWTYDGDGNILTASNDNGAYTFSYDYDGQVTLVDEPFGVSLSMGYDGDGNRTLVLDNFGGVESSTYDGDHLLLSRSYTGYGPSLLATFVYDADGMVTHQADFSGGTLAVTMDTSYDGDNNVTNIHDVTAAPAATLNFDYAYDQASQMTQETDYYGTPDGPITRRSIMFNSLTAVTPTITSAIVSG